MRTSSLRNVCQFSSSGGILKLMHNTAVARLPRAPRPDKSRHGLGLSCKPSWGPNGPVLQEKRACLAHRPVYASLLPAVNLRLRYTTGNQLPYTGLCAQGKA